MSGWRARLDELAARYALPSGAAERLAALLALVRDDPTAPTTVRDPAEAVDVHVADSLVALELPQLAGARTIADIGAGAGFPGLPLAVALPGARMALVESLGRKCSFLHAAVEAAGVANADIVCARAEEWAPQALDVVCVRAVAPLAVLAEYAAPLLQVGGSLVAWKGRPGEDEVRAGEAAAAVLGLAPSTAVAARPFAGAEHRTLYVYSKVRDTPPRFPRRPGMARKRPLAT